MPRTKDNKPFSWACYNGDCAVCSGFKEDGKPCTCICHEEEA